ncbi:MAG: hypothetical protein ACXVA9_02410 [Bdellovibrionales bacterium]
MQRREFLMGTGLAALGLMALKANKAFAGNKLFCEGDLNVPLDGQIASNHGHRLLIPRQDILDGKDKSYDIQGQAGHGHIVIVTEELFAELRKTGAVKMSSGVTAGHTHGITLICAN